MHPVTPVTQSGITDDCGSSRSKASPSFTTAPLRLATYLGLTSACLAFVWGVWIIAKTLLFGEPVRGFPTIMVSILFLGGVQLLALGVIGEYLGRIFTETKVRPLYLTGEVTLPKSTQAPPTPVGDQEK